MEASKKSRRSRGQIPRWTPSPRGRRARRRRAGGDRSRGRADVARAAGDPGETARAAALPLRPGGRPPAPSETRGSSIAPPRRRAAAAPGGRGPRRRRPGRGRSRVRAAVAPGRRHPPVDAVATPRSRDRHAPVDATHGDAWTRRSRGGDARVDATLAWTRRPCAAREGRSHRRAAIAPGGPARGRRCDSTLAWTRRSRGGDASDARGRTPSWTRRPP